MKSAYLLAKGLNPLNRDAVSVEWVWEVEALPKIQFSLWLCLHNSVPTGEVLGSRGLSLDPTCSLCHQSSETVEHLLRGYEFAKDYWQQLQFLICMRETFKLSIGEWLEVNCKSDIISKWLGIPWKILFPIGVWNLWLYRNNFIFRTGKMERSYYKKSIKDSAEFFSVGMNAKLPKAKAVIAVG